MLSTLLEKLGALLPKSFLIASFFPMLVFFSLNGALLYWNSGSFRGLTRRYFALDAGTQALYGLPLLVAVAIIAYIFSTLSVNLRQALEGKYLPLALLTLLLSWQRRRLNRLDEEIQRYSRKRWRLIPLRDEWEKALSVARRNQNTGIACTYSIQSLASEKIRELIKVKTRSEIEINELREAVVALKQELEKCAIDQLDSSAGDDDNKDLLNEDHTALLELINSHFRETEDRYISLYNEREFKFSRYKLAPTAMGNLAESVRSYAMSRYDMNVDAFWSRLQSILQEDEKFYASLLDAKTQLDFLVSLFWLTAAFTIGWAVFLVFAGDSLVPFLVVGITGPLLASLFYNIALQNYLAFADILRASIDLYRLKLLQSLHIALPLNSVQERATWSKLNQALGYGEDILIGYKHP